MRHRPRPPSRHASSTSRERRPSSRSATRKRRSTSRPPRRSERAPSRSTPPVSRGTSRRSPSAPPTPTVARSRSAASIRSRAGLAKDRVAQLETTLGTVAVAAPEGWRVQLDTFTEVPTPARLHAGAGVHGLSVRAPGKPIERRDVTLQAGKLVTIELKEEPKVQPRVEVEPVKPPPVAPPPPPPPRTQFWITRRVAGVGVAGVGVAALGSDDRPRARGQQREDRLRGRADARVVRSRVVAPDLDERGARVERRPRRRRPRSRLVARPRRRRPRACRCSSRWCRRWQGSSDEPKARQHLQASSVHRGGVRRRPRDPRPRELLARPRRVAAR